MRLFHLVKQHHAVGVAAHRLGQLAALLVAHVSRRRPDQAADAELLHILGHVDPHQVLLIVKQALGQGLRQLGLAHAGRAQKEEAADRAVRVRNARAAAQNRLRHPVHRLVLPDHTLVQGALQREQLLALALHQLFHRDARPARDDPRDLILGHLVPQQVVGAVLGRLGRLFGLLQLLLQGGQLAIFQLGRLVEVILPLGLLDGRVHLLHLLAQFAQLADAVLLVLPAGLHRGVLVPHPGQLLLHRGQPVPAHGVGLLGQRSLGDLMLHDLAAQIVQLGRHAVQLGLDHRAGLVHQVDRLVRQKAVADIPVRQGRRRDQRAVLNLDPVEDLVPLLEAPQDADCVLHRRLLHHHRLEPTLEGGILLDILAVLVKGRRADAVQLAPRQHRL